MQGCQAELFLSVNIYRVNWESDKTDDTYFSERLHAFYQWEADDDPG